MELSKELNSKNEMGDLLKLVNSLTGEVSDYGGRRIAVKPDSDLAKNVEGTVSVRDIIQKFKALDSVVKLNSPRERCI